MEQGLVEFEGASWEEPLPLLVPSKLQRERHCLGKGPVNAIHEFGIMTKSNGNLSGILDCNQKRRYKMQVNPAKGLRKAKYMF